MVSFSLRSLILSATLAALATFTTAQTTLAPVPTPHPVQLDACATLSSKSSTSLTVEDVANCYKAVPFDSTVAASTLESVLTIFKDYYSFRDSALTPTFEKPFDAPPSDIVRRLETIGRTKYTSDYSFHSDVRAAVDSLFDAHSSYIAKCYNAYLFAQTITLYAPVTDGKQSVRVFHDFLDRGYQDCTVEKIEGQDALPYIYNWATKTTSFSKDGGVRLTEALGTQQYNVERNGTYTIYAGAFAQRATLPEKNYVDYELRCNSSATTIQLREDWRVLSQVNAAFNDVQSFKENLCLRDMPSAIENSPAQIQKRDSKKPKPERPLYLVPAPKKALLLDDILNAPPTQSTFGEFEDALKLGAGNGTAFYQLKSRPEVGVMVVFTHLVRLGDEVAQILTGLDTFNQLNVTNVILDFQGNFGGSVEFASVLTQLLFPGTDILDKTLPSDLRVTKEMQQAASALMNNTDADLFNAGSFIDLKTNSAFTSDSLFQHPITRVRNGRSSLYTELMTIKPLEFFPKLTEAVANHPWSDKPANIRILTDGRCGSACAMSCHVLTTQYNVTSYAIGGITAEPLSMFSFVGGAVATLTEINRLYELAGMESPVKQLPYNGGVNFPVVEVYARGSEVPLDFEPQYHRATHRLDYTTQNARKRDVMWSQVANDAWKH
ncbi:hypothetical protein BG011_004880 [Mortierella polycephala]|uniref:Tail specific protease domain-containing protein n=1 Tax=Mortierella polycephala TaxID=41804 RepID=A0A9P6Q0D9_9FUNG|nr:hypothetical protein BG011_004880 [Mortierella polycephala]